MVRSMDLRARLLAAVDRQSSCRAAADRFGVAPSTAVRWRVQQREAGDIAPKPRGGDMRSRRMEERAADILAIWEERRDITLEELRLALADKGMAVSVAGLHRFLFAEDWPCRCSRVSDVIPTRAASTFSGDAAATSARSSGMMVSACRFMPSVSSAGSTSGLRPWMV